MSTVALTMALLTIRSFLFIIVFITFIFARTARSLIQYDRQALLDVCSSMGKDFFTPYQTLCGDSFVLPPPCLRRQRRRKKEVNLQVFYADLGQDTAIRRYREFDLQMFNPWRIKWTNCTHGLTFSEKLQTAACWRLLRPG